LPLGHNSNNYWRLRPVTAPDHKAVGLPLRRCFDPSFGIVLLCPQVVRPRRRCRSPTPELFDLEVEEDGGLDRVLKFSPGSSVLNFEPLCNFLYFIGSSCNSRLLMQQKCRGALHPFTVQKKKKSTYCMCDNVLTKKRRLHAWVNKSPRIKETHRHE
jgi:hypothetical protein